MRPFLYLLIVFYLFSFLSCEVINPEEDIPAFLYIPEITFETQSGEGSDSENITEVWVNAGGKFVGIYDLPATVPVLNQGNVDLFIRAGIKNNGISAERVTYPFYLPYQSTVELEPNETDTVIPAFVYDDNLSFWLEEFEDPGIKFSNTELGDTAMYITNEDDQVFEGNGSGVVYLDELRPYFLGITDENFQFPAGDQIYAEINYKTNNSFAIGIQSNNNGIEERDFALIVNPSDLQTGTPVWKKIYVQLSFVIGQNSNASSYEIYLESQIDANKTEAELLFDNIKIVYLP